MSSYRLAIRDQVITELNTNAPSDMPTATKRRYLPGEPITAPRLSVFFIEEASRLPQGRNSPVNQRSLQIAVQCSTAVDDPADADDEVEPMLMWAVEALADSRLNNLVLWVEEIATRWAVAQMDRVYVQATVIFLVHFQTKRNDLELQG